MSTDSPSRKRKAESTSAGSMGAFLSKCGFRQPVAKKAAESAVDALADQGESEDKQELPLDVTPVSSAVSSPVKQEEKGEAGEDVTAKPSSSGDHGEEEVDDVAEEVKADDDDVESLPVDCTPDSSPAASPVEKEKKEDSDGDIKVEKIVSTRSQQKKTSIKEFGYHFKDGKLRTIEGDEPFKFTTQRDYEQLGDLIGDYVYTLLEELGLEKKYFEVGRNRRFYFASPGYEEKDRILVLIHGSGVVKAGQWARRLIINESLERGAQLEYIKRGLKKDWGVVVLNYNEKCEGQSKGCHGPDAHGCEEWKHAITRECKEMVVVAHSAGGSVISEVVRRAHRVEDYRVLCVVLTDSWFSEGDGVFAVNFGTQKKRLYRANSGVFHMYSGDDTHEGTSAACMNACFALLEAVTENTDEEQFADLLELSEKIVLKEYSERMKKKREEGGGETASTKSLQLEGAKMEKTDMAKGDQKENDKKEAVKAEEKKEEAAVVAPVREPERNPSDNEEDSDEGVEKDVPTPEKSDTEN